MLGLKRALRYKLQCSDGNGRDEYEVQRRNKMDKDPFLYCGYGINAYFYMIYQLFLMMLVISVIFAIPLMIIYNNAGTESLTGLMKYSLGSLGGA